MSNSMDPDQDRHSVGPDLGPNYLQRLSSDNTLSSQEDSSEPVQMCRLARSMAAHTHTHKVWM